MILLAENSNQDGSPIGRYSAVDHGRPASKDLLESTRPPEEVDAQVSVFPSALSRHLSHLRLEKVVANAGSAPELAAADRQASVKKMLVLLREIYGRQ